VILLHLARECVGQAAPADCFDYVKMITPQVAGFVLIAIFTMFYKRWLSMANRLQR
jgi:hypothetical protein